MSVKQYCTHRHGLNEFSRNKYAVIELFNTPQNYNVSGYRIDVDLANMFANFDDLTLGNNFSNSNGTVIAGNQNELVLTSNEIGCVFDGDEGDIILPLGTYRISVNMSVYSASITTTMFTYLRKNSVLTGPYQYEAFTNNRDDQIGFENIVMF